MRKVKIVLMSFILIVSFLLNNTYVNADTNTPAHDLYELGLLSDVSDVDLNQTLDRIVGLTMILKSIGYSDDDAKRSGNEHLFNDFTGNFAWGNGWANIGIATNITTGKSLTKFSPKAPITRKEFLTYQLRALGYGTKESWDYCSKLSVDAGLIEDAFEINDIVRFTKADAARIMYAALNSKIGNNSGTYLIEQLIADGIVSYDLAQNQRFSALNNIEVTSVQPITNSKIEVILMNVVKFISVNDFSIKNSQGTKVPILSAVLSSEGKMVTLVTDVQKDAYSHILTTRDQSMSYNPLKADIVKPIILSCNSIYNKKVKLVFNEKVDDSALDSSHYKINDLIITKAEYELDSLSKPIKTNILLTTTTQIVNISYKLVVSNVKDLSDNIIDPNYDEAIFTGKIADTAKPRVISVYPLTNFLVKVSFSENIDEIQAQNCDNYRISGLSIAKAVRQSNPSVVYLTTSEQIEGYLYSMYAYQIVDYENNLIDFAYNGYSFIGKGVDIIKPTLIGAIALSNTTIKVTFSDPLSDETAAVEYAYDLGNELGYPSQIKKDTIITDGTVWILTTISQESKQYTLDVTGVQDMSGNFLDENADSATFMGLLPD